MVLPINIPKGTNVKTTLTKKYGKHQAKAVANHLIQNSIWFMVTPAPFDVSSITVKNEQHDPLPEPINPKGLDISKWTAILKTLLVEELSDADLRVYQDYFTRGLSPSQAIAQAQTDEVEA